MAIGSKKSAIFRKLSLAPPFWGSIDCYHPAGQDSPFGIFVITQTDIIGGTAGL
jgi:hypothetical protein